LRRQAIEDGRRPVVAAIVRNREGKVFVHRRGPERVFLPNGWDVLGGHVEDGESLLEALAREIEEESGWTLTGRPELVYTVDWETNEGDRRIADASSTSWWRWTATSSIRASNARSTPNTGGSDATRSMCSTRTMGGTSGSCGTSWNSGWTRRRPARLPWDSRDRRPAWSQRHRAGPCPSARGPHTGGARLRGRPASALQPGAPEADGGQARSADRFRRRSVARLSAGDRAHSRRFELERGIGSSGSRRPPRGDHRSRRTQDDDQRAELGCARLHGGLRGRPLPHLGERDHRPMGGARSGTSPAQLPNR